MKILLYNSKEIFFILIDELRAFGFHEPIYPWSLACLLTDLSVSGSTTAVLFLFEQGMAYFKERTWEMFHSQYS